MKTLSYLLLALLTFSCVQPIDSTAPQKASAFAFITDPSKLTTSIKGVYYQVPELNKEYYWKDYKATYTPDAEEIRFFGGEFISANDIFTGKFGVVLNNKCGFSLAKWPSIQLNVMYPPNQSVSGGHSNYSIFAIYDPQTLGIEMNPNVGGIKLEQKLVIGDSIYFSGTFSGLAGTNAPVTPNQLTIANGKFSIAVKK